MGTATERMRLTPVSFFSTEARFFDVRLNVQNTFGLAYDRSDLVVELFFGKSDERDSRKPIPANIVSKIEAIPGMNEVSTYALEKEGKMTVCLPRPRENFKTYRDIILRFLEELEKCVQSLSPYAKVYSLTMSESRSVYI